MIRAALYLRSSKDRSDVSIDAQRRELLALAEARGFVIVKEFSDVVESAKTEDRPGFQALLADLKHDRRGWDHLLLTDTSRLSRRQYMAHVFDHECRKRCVTVLYSKLPNVDELSDMVVKSVLRVFDEFHSHMSRAKGLAGMAENVRRGYRAGGRAPCGYRLEHVATGAIREGLPVMKSRLMPSHEAACVRRYLQLRLTGRPRRAAARLSGLHISALVDLEWNALTYAGCTVWNMRSSYVDGRRQGRKRRPRADWVIQDGTHEGLITRDEAEQLLGRLEHGSDTNYRARESKHLLTGLLRTPAGIPWNGWGIGRYRVTTAPGANRSIKASMVDTAVLSRIREDLLAPALANRLLAYARRARSSIRQDASKPLHIELRQLTAKIGTLTGILTETTELGPILRKIEEYEHRRLMIKAEIAKLEGGNKARMAMASITEEEVHQAIERRAAAFEGMEAEDLRSALGDMVEKVELDPDTLGCRVCYRMAVVMVKRASPRGVEPLLPP